MPTYINAPITEALIDFQVELPIGTTVTDLEAVFDRIKEQYPTKKKRFFFEGQLTIGEEPEASAKQTDKGFAFYSTDGLQIIQARLDGFTFSRLRPYGSWQELRHLVHGVHDSGLFDVGVPSQRQIERRVPGKVHRHLRVDTRSDEQRNECVPPSVHVRVLVLCVVIGQEGSFVTVHRSRQFCAHGGTA